MQKGGEKYNAAEKFFIEYVQFILGGELKSVQFIREFLDKPA